MAGDCLCNSTHSFCCPPLLHHRSKIIFAGRWWPIHLESPPNYSSPYPLSQSAKIKLQFQSNIAQNRTIEIKSLPPCPFLEFDMTKRRVNLKLTPVTRSCWDLLIDAGFRSFHGGRLRSTYCWLDKITKTPLYFGTPTLSSHHHINPDWNVESKQSSMWWWQLPIGFFFSGWHKILRGNLDPFFFTSSLISFCSVLLSHLNCMINSISLIKIFLINVWF